MHAITDGEMTDTMNAQTARILVVDDEPHIRRVLATILENDGFEVHEASDGAQGMDAINSEKDFDFVLLRWRAWRAG